MLIEHMDSTLLIEKAQEGDTGAFAEIYDRYAQRIFRYIRPKLPTQESAEDALQEIFVKAWANLPKFELRESGLTPWLYRIATNQINDYYRQNKRRPETLELKEEIDVPYEPESEKMPDQDVQDSIKNAFNLLPENYRRVLELRFMESFTIEETSKILNKSNLAIRLIQHRALKKVRVLMEEQSNVQ